MKPIDFEIQFFAHTIERGWIPATARIGSPEGFEREGYQSTVELAFEGERWRHTAHSYCTLTAFLSAFRWLDHLTEAKEMRIAIRPDLRLAVESFLDLRPEPKEQNREGRQAIASIAHEGRREAMLDINLFARKQAPIEREFHASVSYPILVNDGVAIRWSAGLGSDQTTETVVHFGNIELWGLICRAIKELEACVTDLLGPYKVSQTSRKNTAHTRPGPDAYPETA